MKNTITINSKAYEITNLDVSFSSNDYIITLIVSMSGVELKEFYPDKDFDNGEYHVWFGINDINKKKAKLISSYGVTCNYEFAEECDRYFNLESLEFSGN